MAAVLGTASTLSVTTQALAEVPAAGASSPATPPKNDAPTDLVILKSGGMLRGTISEMDPNGEVAIQLLTGEIRRIAMSEVKYAGPAANAPKDEAAAEAPPKKKEPERKSKAGSGAKQGEAKLSLTANRADVTFHLRTHSSNFEGAGYGYSSQGGGGSVVVSGTSAGYTVMCMAPCETSLRTGHHRMALSWEGGAPVEASRPIPIRGPAKVEGIYQSNAGYRIAGWVVGVASLVAGTVLIMNSGDDTDKLTAGFAISVIGGGGGFLLATMKDSAELRVTPASDARTRAKHRRAARPRSGGSELVF